MAAPPNMSIVAAMTMGSLGTLLAAFLLYRARDALAARFRRALDWGGARLDAHETRFKAQLDGAFTQDADEDLELSADELAQLQTLERELRAPAAAAEPGGAAALPAAPGGDAPPRAGAGAPAEAEGAPLKP
jgi:hypothetical protein